MKRSIIFIALLCLISINNTYTAPTNKRSLLQGCIKIDNDEQKVPEIRILFNGMETKNNREGLFAFPLSGPSSSVYKIIICQSLDQNFETANTIQAMSLPERQRSRIITLNCLESEDGSLMCESDTCVERSDGTLSCKAKKPLQSRSINMHNSIILLVDPDLVERIEPWNVKMANNFTKLPRIVLKNKPQEELRNASAASLLASLDVKPFHEKIGGMKQKANGGKVKIAVIP